MTGPPVYVMHVGDALSVIRSLPPASVDAVITSPPYLHKRAYLPVDDPAKPFELGQEPTPGVFLANLLDLTDVLWETLAEWGSLWVNLGDTAAFSGGSGGDYNPGGLRQGQARYEGTAKRSARWKREKDGYPLAKSNCWMPQLFGASLAYGRNLLTGEPCRQWITRRPIVWCKPNPSVGELIDAPREATELIILAVKQGRYFFDLDAVRTPPSDYQRQPSARATPPGQKKRACLDVNNPLGAPPLDWWPINTKGYPGAHYAVFPPALIERPMRAGVPELVCDQCGPAERIVTCHQCGATGGNSYRRSFRKTCTCDRKKPRPWEYTDRHTDCGHARRPGIVLDPFIGSGTTMQVAAVRGRSCVGVDLDRRNVDLVAERMGLYAPTVVDHLADQAAA